LATTTANGFYNFDVLLTIAVDPGEQSFYYWAHQFHFKDGDGGYMGLQTNGNMQGEWIGKMAIFSILKALEAELGHPPPAGGVTAGATCEYFAGRVKAGVAEYHMSGQKDIYIVCG